MTHLVGRRREKVGLYVMVAGSLMVFLMIVLAMVLLKLQYFVEMVAVKAMAELWWKNILELGTKGFLP